MCSKLQFGSVPRSLWSGTPASPRARFHASPPSRASTASFRPRAPPRIPCRVQRHGMSTSWLSATAKRAPPPHRGGSTPSERRKRSSGGSSGSRQEADGGKPAVGVPRATPLLEARQMEERLGDIVALRLQTLARPAPRRDRRRERRRRSRALAPRSCRAPTARSARSRRDQRSGGLGDAGEMAKAGLRIVEGEQWIDVRRLLESR